MLPNSSASVSAVPVMPGELLVLAEVVLEGDGRERLVLALDLHLGMRGVVFLGFDRLVQPVAPAAARHQASGELVDDDDLAVLHHVVDVEMEQAVRAQRLIDVVLDVRVLEVVDVAVVRWRSSICSAFCVPVSVSVTVLCFSSTM